MVSSSRRPLAHLALGLVTSALVLLSGCTSTVTPAESAAAPAPPAAAAGPSANGFARSKPVQLRIPSIDVESNLIDLGLKPDGTLEVPPDGSTTGWFTESPTPGEVGPSVLAAHVDWKGAKGVFYDLSRTKPGDIISVQRADGSTPTFVVDRVEQYPKDQFPTTEVYGDVDSAQLRLITCGGEFNKAVSSYRDNIVVYADLVTA